MENTENSQFYDTHIHYLIHWERNLADKVFLVQPSPNGQVTSYTWKEVGRQVRSMAAYLKSLNIEPQSKIAIYGKNSAHWIMADLAIWMAGYVSVPLYPTLNAEGTAYVLEHSEAKLLFIGKLDGKTDSWGDVKTILPNDFPCILLPLAPEYKAQKWNDIIQVTAPLENPEFPEKDDLATIVYTSGSTGVPKGVMQSFATLLAGSRELRTTYQVSSSDRALSYLPLAHVAERIFIESSAMITG